MGKKKIPPITFDQWVILVHALECRKYQLEELSDIIHLTEDIKKLEEIISIVKEAKNI